MNLPNTIWLTSFGGSGEKPGATTNDCCKTGTFNERKAQWGEAWPRHSRAKEQQKVPAAKKLRQRTEQQSLAYLAFGVAPAIEAEIGGKPMPESAKADAWDCKLDENVMGTPPATLELASTLISI